MFSVLILLCIKNKHSFKLNIWKNIDKTPYALFTGKEVFGIFVINNESTPKIEHMYLDKACDEAEKIKLEIQERFVRLNQIKGGN